MVPRPDAIDCSPWPPGGCGDGAVANVAFDRVLRDNGPCSVCVLLVSRS